MNRMKHREMREGTMMEDRFYVRKVGCEKISSLLASASSCKPYPRMEE